MDFFSRINSKLNDQTIEHFEHQESCTLHALLGECKFKNDVNPSNNSCPNGWHGISFDTLMMHGNYIEALDSSN